MTREIEANPPAAGQPRSWENFSVFCERFLHTLNPSVASWIRTVGYHFYVHAVECGATVDANLEDLVQAGAHELRDLAACLRQLEGELPAGFIAARESVSCELEAAANKLLADLPGGGVQAEPPASRLFVRQTFTAAVATRVRELMSEAVPICAVLRTHCATAPAGQGAVPGLAAAIGVALDLHYSAWYLEELGDRYRSCQPLPREKVRLSLLAEEVALTVRPAAERLAATLPEATRQLPPVLSFSEVLSAATSPGRQYPRAAG